MRPLGGLDGVAVEPLCAAAERGYGWGRLEDAQGPITEDATLVHNEMFKGTMSRDYLLLVFFHESVSPQPQSIALGPFRIFSKIREDIRKSRCTMHRYQQHWRQIFPPVSLVLLISVANNGNSYQTADNLKWTWRKKCIYMLTLLPKGFQKKYWEIFLHLPPVSLTPVGHLELRISPRIFEKNRNGPNGIIRGFGETDPCRKPEVKNLVALSL